jgi:hypothetical protein
LWFVVASKTDLAHDAIAQIAAEDKPPRSLGRRAQKGAVRRRPINEAAAPTQAAPPAGGAQARGFLAISIRLPDNPRGNVLDSTLG